MVAVAGSSLLSAFAKEEFRAASHGGISCSPREKKSERRKCSRGGTKLRLVSYDSLPDYLKHNEFIFDYYRSEWPWKQTILSIFYIHNETINVWTHLIGFFLFLFLTIWAAVVIPTNHASHPIQSTETAPATVIQTNLAPLASSAPNASDFHRVVNSTSSQIKWSGSSLPNSWYLPRGIVLKIFRERSSQINPTSTRITVNAVVMSNVTSKGETTQAAAKPPVAAAARWPFFAFLFGAMFCLLTSSLCHLLCCHSQRCSYVMLRLDYAGISTLIVTSFYPLVYYAFLCDPLSRNLYIGFITIFGAAAVTLSLVPVFETPEFRTVRAGLFFCMGVSGLVPIVHKALLYGQRPEVLATTAYEAAMGVFYALGVVVYAARVPERWMPGKFDLAGHSHQLFHVLVVAGAYTHYLAGLVYLQWRDVEGC